jgi:predicted MPP superfamily phosphohydrolase
VSCVRLVTIAAGPDARNSAVVVGSRRALGRWLWALPGVILLGLGLWAFWLEPRRLIVHDETLELPHWPAALHGMRVALLSDLHVGSPYWHLPELERLVERVNREQPELVLLAGDYLITRVAFGTWIDPESIAERLSRLRAPLGVVAVLGNHDWWNNGHRVRAAFEAHGIVVLDNEAHAIEYNQTPFFVVGLADALTRRVRLDKAMAGVTDGAPFIVLAHEPDSFPALPDRAALMLAGHTHGGQVRLPLVGRPVVPSRYGQRYAAGYIVEDGRHLFVTTGVGTSHLPVRFGVPPEIALLSLR